MSAQFKRSNVVKLIVSIVSVLVVVGAILYRFRFLGSGFFWWARLPNLVQDIQTGHFTITPIYSTFPYSPPFLFSISKVTGSSIIDVIYFPLLSIFSFFSYYLLSREILDKNIYIFSSAITLTLYHYGSLSHFTEYPTGNIAFVIFIWAIIKYTDHNKKFLPILLFIYILIKFFSPHAEVWALSFILILTFLLPIITRIKSLRVGRKKITGLAVACICISFAYNPKIYQQAITSVFTSQQRDASFVNTITQTYINLFSGSSASSGAYVNSALTPPMTRYTNIIYISLLFIGLIIGISASLLQIYRHQSFEFYKKSTIIITIASVATVPDFVITASEGLLNISKLLVISPIAIFRYLEINFDIRSSTIRPILWLFAIIMIILPCIYLSGVYLLDTQSQVGSLDAAEETSNWVINYEMGDNRVDTLMDLNSAGILKTTAIQTTNTNPYALVPFSNSRYASITGSSSNDTQFEIFILNNQIAHLPLQRGYPNWEYYDPPEEHKTDIMYNHDLNRVYNNGQYEIYS